MASNSTQRTLCPPACTRRGVETLLVEAGGDLLFQFLAAGALDEIHVTLCPMIIGGDTPSLADGEGFLFAHMPRLRRISTEVEGDEIFLHYSVLSAGSRPLTPVLLPAFNLALSRSAYPSLLSCFTREMARAPSGTSRVTVVPVAT